MSGSGPIPAKRFRLIEADFPWHFDTWSDKGQGRSPSRHYQTMTDEEIFAFWDDMNLDRVVARDCVLVMWATWPKLEAAFQALRAFGFRYSTGRTWVKLTSAGIPAAGTGLVFPGTDEPFLIGKRGNPKQRDGSALDMGGLVNVYSARREHSRKPDEFKKMIERRFRGPALELFSRGAPRPGWTLWGNEVGKFGG